MEGQVAGGPSSLFLSTSSAQPASNTHRKALYMGRYQQTKEQGVKRRTQRMESPKPEPLLVSTQKLAKQARKFRSRASVLPAGCRGVCVCVWGAGGGDKDIQ